MLNPLFQGRTPTLNIAHRGGADLYPENTILAFENAQDKHTVDMIETDVHLTADDQVVIFHDQSLERTTNGQGYIAEWTYSDLSQLDAAYHFTRNGGASFPHRNQGLRIPRLSDVLARFPDMKFNIDLKAQNSRLASHVVDIINRANASARICVGSEYDEIAELLVGQLPKATHFFPVGALMTCMSQLIAGAHVTNPYGYQVLAIPLRYQDVKVVNPTRLHAAHSAGLRVTVWTVNDTQDMLSLIDMGVDGVMTDRPDRLHAALDGFAQPEN